MLWVVDLLPHQLRCPPSTAIIERVFNKVQHRVSEERKRKRNMFTRGDGNGKELSPDSHHQKAVDKGDDEGANHRSRGVEDRRQSPLLQRPDGAQEIHRHQQQPHCSRCRRCRDKNRSGERGADVESLRIPRLKRTVDIRERSRSQASQVIKVKFGGVHG